MKRLSSLFAAAVLAVASATASYAATFTFTGIATNGPLAGTPLSGSGSYDAALVPDTGGIFLRLNGFLDPNTVFDPTLSFSLTIFGQTFTEANDVDAPLFPLFGFMDGILTSVDFIVEEDGANPTSIMEPSVVGFSGFDVVTDQTGAFVYNVELEYASLPAIPLPAGLPLALGALGMLGLLRAKRQANRPSA